MHARTSRKQRPVRNDELPSSQSIHTLVTICRHFGTIMAKASRHLLWFCRPRRHANYSSYQVSFERGYNRLLEYLCTLRAFVVRGEIVQNTLFQNNFSISKKSFNRPRTENAQDPIGVSGRRCRELSHNIGSIPEVCAHHTHTKKHPK